MDLEDLRRMRRNTRSDCSRCRDCARISDALDRFEPCLYHDHVLTYLDKQIIKKKPKKKT